MQLTREQVNIILQNAPAGSDKTKILDGLIMRGYDIEGVDSNIIKQKLQPTKPQSFIQDAVSDIGQVFSGIKSSYQNRSKNVQNNLQAMEGRKQGILRTTAQNIGQGAGLVSDIIDETTKGGIKAVLPQKAEAAVKSGVSRVVTPVVTSDIVQNVLLKYENLDAKTKRDIDATIGFGSLAAELYGGKWAKKGIELGLNKTLKTLNTVGSTALKAGDIAGDTLSVAKKVVGSASDVANMTGKNIARIPSRIITNANASKTALDAIKELPTKIAKNAVQDGIDISDVKYFYKIPQSQKKPLKKLWEGVKDFVSKKTKTNPDEIVGRPIINRIKELESAKGVIGQKLGKVSERLGDITTEEITPEIFTSLQKVTGLSGLTVNKKGILNFTDTVLATAGTASDRKAIQQIFTDAIKAGTGKQKHLLRQELFEILGGKKGKVVLTGTQERAYEAVRSGVANILDTKNALYKDLNNQFRRVAQPLVDMKKFMRGVVGADEDLLEMSAGLLARRITSHAPSNPIIRKILRAMDAATEVKGKSMLSVESLQDFYNILDRYYDIAGKTSFQGQIITGIEKAGGIKNALYRVFGDVAGQTDAVRREALERAISEALR